MNKHVYPADVLPQDKERVFYFFSPFEKWYEGTFYEEGESDEDVHGPIVSGLHGFTTWHPEVTMWMKTVEDLEEE